MKANNDELRKYVKSKAGLLSIDERDHLLFNHDFLLKVLEKVEAFVGGVYRLAQRKMMDE